MQPFLFHLIPYLSSAQLCCGATAHTISDPLISDLVRETVLLGSGEPLSGGAEHRGMTCERQEGLPLPAETNGADRRSDHSSNTKYNNEHSRQLAHRAKRREREPATEKPHQFCGAP